MQGIAAVCIRSSRATPARSAVVGRDGAAFGIGGVDGLVEEFAASRVVFGGRAFYTLAKAKPAAHPCGQCAVGRAGSGRGGRSGKEEGLDEDVWKEEAADDDEEKERGGAPEAGGHIYTLEEGPVGKVIGSGMRLYQ